MTLPAPRRLRARPGWPRLCLVRGAVLHEHGGTPGCAEFDEPSGPGEEVVVDVAAAGLHHSTSSRRPARTTRGRRRCRVSWAPTEWDASPTAGACTSIRPSRPTAPCHNPTVQFSTGGSQC